MKSRTLEQQIQARCVHFNGLINERCEIGIEYLSVRDSSRSPYRWPCHKGAGGGDCHTVCHRAEFLTDEQAKNEADETRGMLDAFFSKIESGICPHCDTEIKARQQVGRCAYAEPCGCRLYQGKA